MKTPKHPKLTNGQPAISCFYLSQAELTLRLNLAHEQADLLGAKEHPRNAEEAMRSAWASGRTRLWHTNFASGLRLMVCDNPLFRLTACLPTELKEANAGRALDFWDYAYVADMLRELLLEKGAPKGDKPSLRRALAWVEEKGRDSRDYSLERD